MEVERKLAEFRARKNREQKIEKYKDKFRNMFAWKVEDNNDSPESEVLINQSDDESTTPQCLQTNSNDSEEEVAHLTSKMKKEFYILFFILWAATYYLFIQLQFGIIYLIISAIIGIYLNTRTGPKDKNEISAYSVFNKNCESIDGTLKAEQFEREIRFGSMSVH